MKRCKHHKAMTEVQMPYLEWHLNYAPKMQAKYGNQKQCPKCKLYFWPPEMGKESNGKK